MTDQKVALITAGGSGMGADAARRLAADNFAVAILSSSGKGEALAEQLGGIGVTGSNRSTGDLPETEDRRAPIPMGRYGKAGEVSGLIAYLASDEAAYISGQNIRIDGGLTRSV